MAESANPEFRITCSEKVRSDILGLMSRVQQLDEKSQKQFRHALRTIFHNLANKPTYWGDPVRTLKHLKLIIYHGFFSGISVHYIVLEDQRSVVIHSIKTTLSLPSENGPDQNS